MRITIVDQTCLFSRKGVLFGNRGIKGSCFKLYTMKCIPKKNVQGVRFVRKIARKDYIINKMKKALSDPAIRNCGPVFLELIGQDHKTVQKY